MILRGRPPFKPLALAALIFASLLRPPSRAAITLAAIVINDSLASTSPAIEMCRSRCSRHNAPPAYPRSIWLSSSAARRFNSG